MITLHKYEISGSIKDRYGCIIYSLDFENLNKTVCNELKFEITIDPNAFISKFEANIDDEIFIGKTKEKERASKEYKSATEKNENAILISQPHENIPNVFQIKTNIDAKSKILLTIQIEQYLQKQFDFNNMNIQILRNFNKYNITPNFDHIVFKLNIEDKSGIYNVNIPMTNNNDIIINENIMDKMNKKCQINGKIMSKSSINELMLKYKIKGEEEDASYVLFDNKSNTFCHIISDIITDSNVDNENNNILIPRRVIFLIDRSQSMSGSKWNKTISSTIIALKQLKKGYDRFGIILFDNNIELLPYNDTKGCIVADDKTISDSVKLLQNRNIGGGTNINDALLKAIELIKIDILLLNDDNNYKYNFFMNQIIFITDGEPNNGERNTTKIMRNIKTANDLSKIDKYNNKICIFSFGIGKDGNDSGWIKDLNHSFLKSLSLNNNGFYQRIKQTSADTVFSQYFNILSKPILTNINIEYNNKNIKHLTESKFDVLYAGNDLIICGKIENMSDYNLSLTISAITGKQIKQNNKSIIKPINICKQIKININAENNNDQYDDNNIEKIWAYLKLKQLATKKLIYNDMIDIDDDEKKEDESIPLSLALKYKFVTPWTSMIVVKKKKDETKEQQNELQIGDLITKTNNNNDNLQSKTTSIGKKLSANAPVFDVSYSPTLDPYAGPNAIRTHPTYVPPANILNDTTQQTQQQQQQEQQTSDTTKTGKVRFTTFTNEKNARAVGSTMAYKHPSRVEYGQPSAKLKDSKFTNGLELSHVQRWELLSSAKRWLPGEGTFITYNNYRYLIGPPIYMGINGHIHYCYKYALPSSNNKDVVKSPSVSTLAAKIVPNTSAFAREIVILRALQECENVIKLYDVLESQHTLISILELAQSDVYQFFVRGDCRRHGWNLDKPAVREHFSKMVISNVVQGLDEMHRSHYLHCDLKSLNILLYIYITSHSNRRGGVYIKAKLTDFGHSSHGTTLIAKKLFSNGMARVGTAGHVAPELFIEGRKCTQKIDIWSLGIVMFNMLVRGRLLFSEYTNLNDLKKGYDGLNKMNPWSNDRPSWWTDFECLSPESRDLILWMTRYHAIQRPSCSEILKHPWFIIGKDGHRKYYRPKLKYVDMLCSSSIAQE